MTTTETEKMSGWWKRHTGEWYYRNTDICIRYDANHPLPGGPWKVKMADGGGPVGYGNFEDAAASTGHPIK